MTVNSLNDAAQRRQKQSVLVRVCARVEQVDVSVGDRPVVVLARPVDAGKRLFVKQTRQIVPLRRSLQDVHDEHVVVNRQVEVFEHRGEFKLTRRDFVVPRFGGNAQRPKLFFDVCHEVQNSGLNRAEVMVVELLMFGGNGAEERSTRLDEVRTHHVLFAVDEEVFLFRAEGDKRLDVRLFQPKDFDNAFDRTA